MIRNVYTALDAYWKASNRSEEQAAYYAILLFGGRDGYPGTSRVRAATARFLRRLAIRVEGEDKWGRPLPL